MRHWIQQSAQPDKPTPSFRRVAASFNQTVQRTGASRFAQRQIERHRRLAPVADLCVRLRKSRHVWQNQTRQPGAYPRNEISLMKNLPAYKALINMCALAALLVFPAYVARAGETNTLPNRQV